MEDVRKYLREKKLLVDGLLKSYLDKSTKEPKTIHTAMRYSVLNGGKRIRPILALIGNEILGGRQKDVYEVVTALELVHCYSLVHDDLPSLDNDDYRRGRYTTHKVYGNAIAILAGDALLTKAFEVLSLIKNEKILKKVLNVFSRSVGSCGMIGGQVKDIESENKKYNKDKSKKLLEYIHKNKTAKLIEASLLTGALTANPTKKQYDALSTYGQCLGLLFQISDDILDVTSNIEKLGKSGTDVRNKKLTYPSVYGISKSKDISFKLAIKAKKAIKVFSKQKRILLEYIVDYVVKRDS